MLRCVCLKVLTIENTSWERTSFIYAKLPKARRISHEVVRKGSHPLNLFLVSHGN